MSNLIPVPTALRDKLRSVIDPEQGINIVDLGLIYDLVVGDQTVGVFMTLTSPACPMGDQILDDVEECLRQILPSGYEITIELQWTPPWDPSRMSDAARAHFGWTA